MAKTNLYRLLEQIDEAAMPVQFHYLNPDGTVNYNAVPYFTWAAHTLTPPLQISEMKTLMDLTAPDAMKIIMAIADQNVSASFHNRIYLLFVDVVKKVHEGTLIQQGKHPKFNAGALNSKMNPKTQQIFENYKKALGDFVGLFNEIELFINRRTAQQKIQNPTGQQQFVPPVILKIKDFKNLTTYIKNTPKYQHITDAIFDDFYDIKNQEAQTYYELMAKGDDTQPTPAGDIGVVYDMFKDMRRQCDITVKSYAALQHQMGAIHNYYGTSGGDSKGKKSKEFYATKALNLHSIKNHDLVRFKYKLLDTDGSPYRGSNVEYLGTFRYYDLRNTYKFINDVDKNNIFEFLSPKPNPINLNTNYNIEYSSLRHTKTQMQIYVTAIEIQKVDAQQDFINCSAVEELKELVRDIRENTK